GIETLLEIKRAYPDKFEETPIISLTASAVSGDKEKMLRAGFTDYLPKPVNIDDMERMLIKYLPKDSVVITEDTAVTTTDEDEDEDDELSKLPEIIFEFEELDPKKGIGYCGDADDYIYALETYAESIDSKSEQIEAALKSGDHEAYTINVHSLKSTSQAIGAMRLYEMAKALEAAGKDRDDVTMQKDTPVMMRAYREIKEVLQRIVESAEG
ncbi:MAG: Hpt domain-containing protein, partial [Lachnospiraceae bacterium]|nr:Hpt domain-containing protein [Lachnospiraceae bacterium]